MTPGSLAEDCFPEGGTGRIMLSAVSSPAAKDSQ